MSDLAIGGLGFLVMFALMALRMPIGLAMLVVGAGGTAIIDRPAAIYSSLKTLPYEQFSSYSLSIVPLFLLMGQFATKAGMSRALFDASRNWLGHRRGGVAMSTIGACGAFGAICGSSLATAATMAQVALPEMKRQGYRGGFATGTLAAGGTLGILVPPSVVLVIYAILTGQNIDQMFIAAVVPAALAIGSYMAAISLFARVNPDSAPVAPRADRHARWHSMLRVWPVLLIFLVVIGGIYLGVFTPTEAAAVGAVSTALLAVFQGSMRRREFLDALFGTASATAMIFMIILGANVFNSFLALSQLPQAGAAWVVAMDSSPWLVLAAILFCYLLLGCVMDSLSMILLTVPIFFPIITAMDFGLPPTEVALWFGVLAMIVVEVGMITPPVGLNIFIIDSLAPDVPISHTFKGVLPFLAADAVRIVVLVAFPSLTLGMIRLLY